MLAALRINGLFQGLLIGFGVKGYKDRNDSKAIVS